MDPFDPTNTDSGGDDDTFGSLGGRDNLNFRHEDFEVSPLVPPVPAMHPSSRNSNSGMSPRVPVSGNGYSGAVGGRLPPQGMAGVVPSIPTMPSNSLPRGNPSFTLKKRPYGDQAQGLTQGQGMGSTGVAPEDSSDVKQMRQEVDSFPKQETNIRPAAMPQHSLFLDPSQPPTGMTVGNNSSSMSHQSMMPNPGLAPDGAQHAPSAASLPSNPVGNMMYANPMGTALQMQRAGFGAAGVQASSMGPPSGMHPSSGSPPRANVKPMAGVSPENRPNIRSIVLGAASASKAMNTSPAPVTHPAPVAQPPPVAHAAPVPSASAPAASDSAGQEGLDSKQPERKRNPRGKRGMKTLKKILFAKKEKAEANKLVNEAFDLLEKLPEKDCRFLAENFWILTAAQLEWVISEASGDNGQGDGAAQARVMREEILVKLAESDLLDTANVNVAPASEASQRPVDSTVADIEHNAETAGGSEAQTQISTAISTATHADKEGADGKSSLNGGTDGSEPPAPSSDAAMSRVQEGTSSSVLTTGQATAGSEATSTEFSAGTRAKSPTAVQTSTGFANTTATTVATDVGAAVATSHQSVPALTDMEKQEELAGSDTIRRSEATTTVKAVDGLDAETRKAAEAKLAAWHAMIHEPKKPEPIEKRFPLDGPISCLIPKSMQNFLASAKIKYVYEFLSLRKTESGLITDLYRIWRNKCNLSSLSNLAIAKHTLGVAFRLETALSSPPVHDPQTRQWMMDPIVVLTGAARDFLIKEKKIYSAVDFIEIRTRDLAMSLEEWRTRNMMVALKGSGKVAMVSAWKASARESIEAEKHPGTVLSDIDLEAQSEADASGLKIVRDEETEDGRKYEPRRAKRTKITDEAAPKRATVPEKVVSSGATKKRPSGTSSTASATLDRQLEYTVHSSMFLYDVVGADDAKLLSSVNIKTAHELFEADKKPDSPLYRAILEGDPVVLEGKKATNDSECQMVIENWCQSLRGELEKLRASSPVAKAPPRKRGKSASTVATTLRTSKGYSDPFQGLSDVTQRFLTSIGITSAEKFLSTRTTDIANEFVYWRRKENMPELKGLGAIASVSGWKAQVRKIAKGMGLENVADVEPENKASWGKEAREAARRKSEKKQDQHRAELQPLPMAHQDVLFGKARRPFAVQDDQDSNKQFRFELTVRNSDKGTGHCLFITYKGAAIRSATIDGLPTVSIEDPDPNALPAEMPVLLDAPISTFRQSTESRSPFATLLPECGLIKLNKYGVHPLHLQDLSSLRQMTQTFIISGVFPPKSDFGDRVDESNVLIRLEAKGDYQYLLYLEKPIEMGQTAALRFPNLHSILGDSHRFADCTFRERHILNEALLSLSKHDLQSLRTFFRTEVHPPLDLELRSVQSEETFQHLRQALLALRRLNWLTIQIKNVIGDEAARHPNPLYFQWQTFMTDPTVLSKLSEDQCQDLRNSMAAEVKNELLAAVELDRFCGASRRSLRFPWCNFGLQTFDTVVEVLPKLYCSTPKFFEQAPNLIAAVFKSLCSIPLDVEKVDDCVVKYVMKDSIEAVFPTRGVLYGPAQAYRDALSLCGEVSYDSETVAAEPMDAVVCDVPQVDSGDGTAEIGPFAIRSPSDVRDGSAVLSTRWYRQLQWKITATVVSGFVSLLSPREQTLFEVEDVLSSMKASLQDDVDTNSLPPPTLENHYPLRNPIQVENPDDQVYEPHSFQFFLGLVWPALRKLGWRLDAGEKPSDLTFLVPGPDGCQRKRGRVLKRQRDRQRALLAREANEVGLGFVSKPAKRLFIKTALLDDDTKSSSSSSRSSTPVSATTVVPVKDALDKFLTHIQSGLEPVDHQGRSRAASIVASIQACFEELAPKLADENEVSTHGQLPSSVYGCEILMRFLLVLPGVLQQSGLPQQEIRDSLEAARDLTNFIVAHQEQFFDARFCPPHEEYARKERTNSQTLISRLRGPEPSKKSMDSSESALPNHEESTDFLLPSDKADVTDFVYLVLEQTVPILATADDVQRKRNRVHVGFPGLSCRHCQGSDGEGRYFYSSFESLSASLGILEKHFLKCPAVPSETKSAIVVGKSRHSEQRKKLVSGSQSAFFFRLWERLWSSSAVAFDASSSVYVLKDDGQMGGPLPERGLEFSDHLLILDYIRTTEPWCRNKELEEAVNKYYSCLEYGGRICFTNSMPKHFNAEWLLSKVAPRKTSLKRPRIPG